MKILFISTLYPSSLSPTEAPYNRQLICAIAEKVQEVQEEKKDFAQRRRVRGGETGLSSVSASSASLRETDLSNHSHNVRVIAPVYWLPGRRLPPKEEVIDGIKVTHPRIFYTPGILRNKHWKMYQCSIKKHLKATLDDFKPDHVVIGFAYPDAVAVAPLCREWGMKYSVRVNGSDFRLRVKQPGFREMVLNELNRAPRVFCPGQALKRDMVAEGIPENKITAFNNGVGIISRRGAEDAEKKEEKEKVVLFVGHLKNVKGPDVMLEAWEEYLAQRRRERREEKGSNTSEQLVFIGDGIMRKELETKGRKCNSFYSANSASLRETGPCVTFMGNLPHDQVLEWMRCADCLCLTSRSEGMPNVVVEALSCGLPVVATNVGEVPFMVKDGENGYVVGKAESGKQKVEIGGDISSDLPKDIAEAIGKALSRSWDHRLISDRMKNYTWENAADVVLSALEGI